MEEAQKSPLGAARLTPNQPWWFWAAEQVRPDHIQTKTLLKREVTPCGCSSLGTAWRGLVTSLGDTPATRPLPSPEGENLLSVTLQGGCTRLLQLVIDARGC